MASVLGVSNALVLYHFSTKEKLVAAAFAYAAEADLAHLRKLLARRTTAVHAAAGGGAVVRADGNGQGVAAVDRGLGRLAARPRPA